ncbi:hypothetical protein Dsin_024054 [Dipteronia sinensis]|uniref:Uncharacterized protein n=1 Tax=Dipteronia sinensis TaxID=43782 RepID=A0AAE0A612_9ROSI|nr:hypothetical protein Dsin_024054 [Dipteronia sinensis]
MHTDTVAGHTNLSSRSKVVAALYIGTNSVGVSYFGRDPFVFSQGVKSFWPPLNRKYQDAISIATDIMKIKEEHELCWIVVGCPWFSKRAQAALDHYNQFAKEHMEEHRIVAHVMSSSIVEGEVENDLNDAAVKVESFFEDLMSTGILTGIEIIYYNASVLFNQLRVKKIVEQLTIEGDTRFLFADMTEFEVRYAAEFLLMHYMANEIFVVTPR